MNHRAAGERSWHTVPLEKSPPWRLLGRVAGRKGPSPNSSKHCVGLGWGCSAVVGGAPMHDTAPSAPTVPIRHGAAG